MDLIVAGDIGCYTLGVLPPFNAMDSCVCMGASIGVGLGLRHVLPEDQARRVVSVIGDSTFAHSGLTGLAEMVYNPPKTGHVVLILDNGTTAMTGLQDHPGTGYTLGDCASTRMNFEAVGAAMGVPKMHTVTAEGLGRGFRSAAARVARRRRPDPDRRAQSVPAGGEEDQRPQAGRGPGRGRVSEGENDHGQNHQR